MKHFFENIRQDKALQILLALAGLKLLIHLLTASNYGLFRDELYYIAASKRLAFGYVDFPPFIAVLTAFIRATLGESQLALRFLPALAGSAIVVLAGLMARRFGADRFGQVLAGLCVLVAPQFLGVNSILTMDTFDNLAWAVAIYILVVLFQEDRPKLWLWFGLAAGIGFTIKVSMLYLGLGLVVGLALTPYRKYFRSKYLYLGGAIALAFLLPYVIWNALHGFPTVEFMRNYGGKVFQASPPVFLLQQLLIMQPLAAPLWIAGLVWLFSKKGETFRPLAWIYVTLFVVFMIQNAKNYFLAGAYPMLFAAGALAFEQWSGSGRRVRWRSAAVVTLAVSALIVAPMAIPILPLQAHLAYLRVMGGTNAQSEKFDTGVFPQHFADRFGWEEMAANLAGVYHALPPEDQKKACIFVANYGEAGAIEFYREKYDLPPVMSIHNNYYFWRPKECTGEVVIYMDWTDEGEISQVFEQVQRVGENHCQYCMPYEDKRPIYTCRGLKVPIDILWPQLKGFG
jgi:hypothetical protein